MLAVLVVVQGVAIVVRITVGLAAPFLAPAASPSPPATATATAIAFLILRTVLIISALRRRILLQRSFILGRIVLGRCVVATAPAPPAIPAALLLFGLGGFVVVVLLLGVAGRATGTAIPATTVAAAALAVCAPITVFFAVFVGFVLLCVRSRGWRRRLGSGRCTEQTLQPAAEEPTLVRRSGGNGRRWRGRRDRSDFSGRRGRGRLLGRNGFHNGVLRFRHGGRFVAILRAGLKDRFRNFMTLLGEEGLNLVVANAHHLKMRRFHVGVRNDHDAHAIARFDGRDIAPLLVQQEGRDGHRYDGAYACAALLQRFLFQNAKYGEGEGTHVPYNALARAAGADDRGRFL